jgi:hypothetical protein
MEGFKIQIKKIEDFVTVNDPSVEGVIIKTAQYEDGCGLLIIDKDNEGREAYAIPAVYRGISLLNYAGLLEEGNAFAGRITREACSEVTSVESFPVEIVELFTLSFSQMSKGGRP